MVDLLAAFIDTATRSDPLTELTGDPYFSYLGYPLYGLNQTLQGDKETVPGSFSGFAKHAYQASPPVFAVENIRMSVFSEARLMYRRLIKGRPGDLFSTAGLNILRHPWEGATTGDLLTRAILHADLAGNHFAVRRKINGKQSERIHVAAPDRMQIVIGIPEGVTPQPDVDPINDLGGVVVGYLYHANGIGKTDEPVYLTTDEVAHWAPVPDPLASYRGMSWLTPVVREVAGDKQATSHKNKFYENGATPNLIVNTQFTDPDQLRKWVAVFRSMNEGEANAYKSLVLGTGMDATVVGSDFRQLDFKVVQGASETRIAAAGGVGAVIAQLSEGLQGSSLNAGNYTAARRRVADGLFRPLWRSFCGSYESIIPVPRNSELWYDERDIAFLREDEKDAAEIQGTRAQTIRQLVDSGHEPESVVKAVVNDDFTLLNHTGLFSVQLQPPGTTAPDQEPTDD